MRAQGFVRLSVTNQRTVQLGELIVQNSPQLPIQRFMKRDQPLQPLRLLPFLAPPSHLRCRQQFWLTRRRPLPPRSSRSALARVVSYPRAEVVRQVQRAVLDPRSTAATEARAKGIRGGVSRSAGANDRVPKMRTTAAGSKARLVATAECSLSSASSLTSDGCCAPLRLLARRRSRYILRRTIIVLQLVNRAI